MCDVQLSDIETQLYVRVCGRIICHIMFACKPKEVCIHRTQVFWSCHKSVRHALSGTDTQLSDMCYLVLTHSCQTCVIWYWRTVVQEFVAGLWALMRWKRAGQKEADRKWDQGGELSAVSNKVRMLKRYNLYEVRKKIAERNTWEKDQMSSKENLHCHSGAEFHCMQMRWKYRLFYLYFYFYECQWG